MLRATSDFDLDGVHVDAGDEVKPGTFTPAQLNGLLSSKLVTEQNAAKEQTQPKQAEKLHKNKGAI